MNTVSMIISGAGGQLGRSFRDIPLPAHFEPHYFSRDALDIADPEGVQRAFDKTGCSVFVNCAAYTHVDKAEAEQNAARRTNVEAVWNIARICAANNALLIHISTDYVYDNGLQRPLLESDPLNPRSVYAKTKLAGEEKALQANPATIVLRTSWVFSDYGHNFVKTMLKLADQGRSLRVVGDQTGCPTYAPDLAHAIVRVIEVIRESNSGHYGVYNFSNSGPTNWHDFAAEIFRQAHLSPELSSVSTAEYVTQAARPLYSVMDTSLFERTFALAPRSWQEALRECLPRVIST